jgi:hypothetical protein
MFGDREVLDIGFCDVHREKMGPEYSKEEMAERLTKVLDEERRGLPR